MEKQRREESDKRREEEKESGDRRCRCAKREQSRETLCFSKKVGAEGRKVGSLKRQVRSHLAKWKVKNCMPLWREAHFEVKVRKTHQLQNTFRTWDVEIAHAVVAGSTFRSQNVQNTPFLDHFRCGAKHISKSKVGKTEGFGALLDVRMSFCVAGTRDSAPCQKWAKREGFVAFSTTITTTLHYTQLHYTTLELQRQLPLPLHYTTLH